MFSFFLLVGMSSCSWWLEARRVLFLCFYLTHLSQPILFSLLSGGGQWRREWERMQKNELVMFRFAYSFLFVFVPPSLVLGFFLLNSWLEEYLFKQLKSFKFGWYMTAFELMCFAVFAVLERWFRRVRSQQSNYETDWIWFSYLTSSLLCYLLCSPLSS